MVARTACAITWMKSLAGFLHARLAGGLGAQHEVTHAAYVPVRAENFSPLHENPANCARVEK